jgi:hypothetical protein
MNSACVPDGPLRIDQILFAVAGDFLLEVSCGCAFRKKGDSDPLAGTIGKAVCDTFNIFVQVMAAPHLNSGNLDMARPRGTSICLG